MAWGLTYLVHYPLVQARMHDELDRVIGSNRLIDMSDRSQLPYANAVVMVRAQEAIIIQGHFRKPNESLICCQL